MKNRVELIHLIVLVIFGIITGAILKFSCFSDYALAGLIVLLLFTSCVHLYKSRPKWIPSLYEGKEMDQDELMYRFEAWNLWSKNTNIRAISMLLSGISSFLLGYCLQTFIFPQYSAYKLVKDSFLGIKIFYICVILSIILIASIYLFIKKEKEICKQRIWTRSYILEKVRRKMMAEEIMDGTYQE